MFEQDYIMRYIKEMIRVLLKLVFHIDTDAPVVDLLENKKDKQTLELLLNLVDEGMIDNAENKIYEIIGDGNKQNLKVAILFYSYLNDKSDKFLEEHNFSRDEIKLGLQDVTERYGVGDLTEIFMQ
ncbi:MAG: DUF6483 family protein [Eubacterium sp.]|nr:DUF6483 family protein [Eubacterium sp.]